MRAFAHHFGQRAFGVAGEADPPEARLGDLLERAGQIDHAHPRHVSSVPDAERASVPDSGGACRSCVTMPSASNAAAERSTAPTLCGSVT
jgi:hypothetical protein